MNEKRTCPDCGEPIEGAAAKRGATYHPSCCEAQTGHEHTNKWLSDSRLALEGFCYDCASAVIDVGLGWESRESYAI